MKKIGLDTFMDFRMLSSLTFSPDGGKLAYVLTGIDREKNAPQCPFHRCQLYDLQPVVGAER